MLTISPEKVCYLIIKGREFDAKEEGEDTEPASDAVDDGFAEVLEELPDDPVYDELREFLASLNEDELADVLALAWLGRGDYDKEQWAEAVAEAREQVNRRTPEQILEIPLLPDYLEDGLAQLGYSCEDYEMGRL